MEVQEMAAPFLMKQSGGLKRYNILRVVGVAVDV